MLQINFKQAHGKNYTKGRKDKIEWLVVHYTANDRDTAANNAAYFSREVPAHTSANYFVDATSIWQSVNDWDTAHAVGGAKQYYNECRNANSIHIELCDAKYGVDNKTRQNALDLAHYLMDKYDIDINHVVRHYDVTHKKCPAPWVEYPSEWTRFKKQLKEMGEEEMTQAEFNKMLEKALSDMRAKSEPEWAKNEGVVKTAKNNGISDGTAPQGLITRVEVMAMVNRALGKK